MKDAIPADRPLFEIGPKAYLYGADVVALARAADRASEEHDVTVVFTSPILEARAVVDSVEHILVCVPHLDPIRPGRGITDILPEALVEAGVRMVMLNHAEHPITFTVLEKTMQRAAEVGLATAVCARSVRWPPSVPTFSSQNRRNSSGLASRRGSTTSRRRIVRCARSIRVCASFRGRGSRHLRTSRPSSATGRTRRDRRVRSRQRRIRRPWRKQ